MTMLYVGKEELLQGMSKYAAINSDLKILGHLSSRGS